jgi:hypothetical protein
MASFAYAGAFVIAGAEASPGRQVGVGWELRHVRTNFGKNRSGSFFFDTRDGLQQGVLFPELVCAEPGSDFAVQCFYLHFQEIEVAECVPQEKAVMVGKTIPLYRHDQIGDLLLCLPLRKLRDFLCLHDALQKSVDHQPPGEPQQSERRRA